jgi:uncharacterized protein (TIGR03437 family)
MVGGPDDSTTGAVWVFARSGATWTQQGGKMTGSGAVGSIFAQGVGQGCSVALSTDGNIAIEGAYGDNNAVGAAWVFTRSGGAWTQQGNKLVGTGAAGVAEQGYSVALSPNGITAIVGGVGDNSATGAAWVYDNLSPPSLPALVVTSFTAGIFATIGGAVSESATVVNQGTAAAGPFYLGFYLSQKVPVTTNDIDTTYGCMISGGLAVGASATCSGAVGIPSSLAPGVYYLAAIADAGGAVVESYRTNNLRLSANGQITLALPPSITSVSPILPQQSQTITITGSGFGTLQPYSGDSIYIEISDITANWNAGWSGGSTSNTVGLIVSSWTDSQITLAGFQGSYGQGYLLQAGDQIQVNVWNAQTDAGPAVYKLTVQANLPMLVVTSFTAATTGVVGGTVSGSATIANQGTAAAGNFRFEFYLSTSPNVTTSSIDTGYGCTTTNGLPVSASWSCGGSIGIPASIAPGVYYLAAIADNGNVIAQSSRAGNVLDSQNGPITLTAPNGSPSITGVVNGASYQPGFSSGSWIMISGSNLAPNTPNGRAWTNSDFDGNLLPTSLDGVSVIVNGKNAYVSYISPTQINALAPADATLGSVAVQVKTSAGLSNSLSVTKQSASPAIFTYSGGRYGIATVGTVLIGPTGYLVSSTRRAISGEVITLWVNGLGATTPQYPDGQIITQPEPVASAVQVTIGGVAATVQYAGLSATGEYQVNVTVPNLPLGDAALVISTAGVQSAAQVFIPIAAEGTNCVPPSDNNPWFESVYYVSKQDSAGDYLLVGTMSMASYASMQALPLPRFTGDAFCGTITLAPGYSMQAYIPTAAERTGNFSAFSGLLLDPLTQSAFPAGIIPASRIPNPFAWRFVY